MWPLGGLNGWGKKLKFCEGGEKVINSYFVERCINEKYEYVKKSSYVCSNTLLLSEPFYSCFTKIIGDFFKHCTLATSSLNVCIDKPIGFPSPQPCSKEQLVPALAELVFDARNPACLILSYT